MSIAKERVFPSEPSSQDKESFYWFEKKSSLLRRAEYKG